MLGSHPTIPPWHQDILYQESSNSMAGSVLSGPLLCRLEGHSTKLPKAHAADIIVCLMGAGLQRLT